MDEARRQKREKERQEEEVAEDEMVYNVTDGARRKQFNFLGEIGPDARKHGETVITAAALAAYQARVMQRLRERQAEKDSQRATTSQL